MFQYASNILISGGNFTHVSALPTDGQRGIEMLQRKIAPGAFHNSDERYDPPKCHPRTRQAILAKIMKWVHTPEAERLDFFVWLYGPAGSGKSAIAQTIAEMCYEAGLLAASFFFSRQAAGRNDRTRFVATLAYQLALSVPEMREGIGMALEKDPMLFSRSLDTQFSTLIVEPAKDVLKKPSNTRPSLIIVDGLDECLDVQSQANILTVLSTAFQRLGSSFPFYFLIASRPEYHIRRIFESDTFYSTLTTRIVLDNNYCPDTDIRTFFADKFAELKSQHPAGSHIAPQWPSDQDMQRLVKKASGQFIYASTVVKYVCSYRHWPSERLDIVFGVSHADDDSPFSELDAFYRHILTAAITSEKVKDIIMLLVLRPLRRWTQSKGLIEIFMGYRSGEVDILLSDLHSIIDIPPPEDTYGEPRISHASLSDFLLDRGRAGRFFIDQGDAYTKLTMRCLHLLKSPQSLHDLGEKPVISLFRESCLQAKENPELLEQLYSMDLFPVFVRNHEDPSRQVPDLVCWFSRHRHPSYETDIMQHHKAVFHDWLRQRLVNLPSGTLTECILAALTLPQLRSVLSEIFVILGELSLFQNSPSTGENPDELFESLPDIHIHPNSFDDVANECPEYCALLSHFLTRPETAGPFLVNKATYSIFAQKVWDFICRRGYLLHGSSDTWASHNTWFPDKGWVLSGRIPNGAIWFRPHQDSYGHFGKVALKAMPVLLENSPQGLTRLSSMLSEVPRRPWGPDTDILYTEKCELWEAILDYMKGWHEPDNDFNMSTSLKSHKTKNTHNYTMYLSNSWYSP